MSNQSSTRPSRRQSKSLRSAKHRRAACNDRRSRRGAVAVLAAVLMVVMLGFIAFAVDVGYMMTVKTQLQVAADSAAMAAAGNLSGTSDNVLQAAQDFGSGKDSSGKLWHKAGGAQVSIATGDIVEGMWDSNARTFSPTTTGPNSVKVTARRDSSNGGAASFFARIFGVQTENVTASAIALANPRDICFVVDLSGSMNDDTTTGYGASPSYRSSGYASIYQSMMQQVFTDFNFGSYPGTVQKIGQSLDSSATWSSSGSHGLYSKTGPLSSIAIPTAYRIVSSDTTTSGGTAQQKAYKWMIDNQIATLMPNAKPTPNSGNSSSYNYWQAYLSTIVGNSGYRIGYSTYVNWLMNLGRDVQGGGQYGQLSTSSSNCPYHSESVNGTSFQFPPSEQPTHSQRRSVIAGLQAVQSKNSGINTASQQDWVSIVTFDKTNDVKTLVALTSDYGSAMDKARTMQAVGEGQNSTDTEEGLQQAYNLIKPASQGGTGRENTQKIVILLTDGVANLKDSSNSAISSYESAHPNTYNGSSNFYGSSDYNSDAAFMQASTMEGQNWHVYALGIGLAVDTDFMNRMARFGNTADSNGNAPTTSGDPTTYETEMTALLDQIVDNPEVRLVQ